MPTYKYHCAHCGTFEVKRSIFSPSPTECPRCGGDEFYQIFSPPEVMWKGRFRWMKGNPEVDMDKIDAEQNKQARKQAMGKVAKGLEPNKKYF
jgi:putative FmdB family regulatory protein